jgi:hypothetical protein
LDLALQKLKKLIKKQQTNQEASAVGAAPSAGDAAVDAPPVGALAPGAAGAEPEAPHDVTVGVAEEDREFVATLNTVSADAL